MKTRAATLFASFALFAVAGAAGAAEPRGEVQRNRPPSVAEPQQEKTTQKPSEALQKPYEPASGLDHGSVGGTADQTAPSAAERTGKTHDRRTDAAER